MKLYTIQSQNAWVEAQHVGFLVGNKEYVWSEFLEPYQWMMDQMSKRLHNYDGEYPIWLWCHKPDLRSSGHLNRGTIGELLEVELEDQEVLLSDFMAWHIVLANSFLSLTEEEDHLYETGSLTMKKEESWERIFHYNDLRCFEYWKGPSDLQGVTGKIPTERIKHLKTFKAR